jgi:RNA polymerase sigma factor (sigma-70 family)
VSDGQLLETYISRRDEAAFAALLRRHGPMVWGVCRRVVGNHHDAEDAFQATFLVLIRKAASVLPREEVANWLYGVAYRTALKARTTASRKRARERPLKDVPEPEGGEQDLWRDLQTLLDQALRGLPVKYRVPIVLCDLEGRTHKEAAGQLGCPEGTLSARLKRARALLAKRLARHGLVLSGGALAGLLTRKAALASVPTSVMASMRKVANVLAAGQAPASGAISIEVAALTEGVLKAMVLKKIQVASAVLVVLAVALGGACATVLMSPRRASGQTEEKKEAAPTKARGPKEDSDEGGGQSRAKEVPRLLRWKIVFNTKDGKDYAKQLEALGAVLAIPTSEPDRYRVIRDLSKRPVKSSVENLSQKQGLFWVESDKTSLRSLAEELGLKQAPKHIVVSLPKFIEDELHRKELAFAHCPEKEIEETTFQFFRSKRGFDIQVASQRTRQAEPE